MWGPPEQWGPPAKLDLWGVLAAWGSPPWGQLALQDQWHQQDLPALRGRRGWWAPLVQVAQLVLMGFKAPLAFLETLGGWALQGPRGQVVSRAQQAQLDQVGLQLEPQDLQGQQDQLGLGTRAQQAQQAPMDPPLPLLGLLGLLGLLVLWVCLALWVQLAHQAPQGLLGLLELLVQPV
jgi:hypothetical protein